MTVREFIHAHPEEPLDLTAPEGRMLLEAKQIQKLLEGRAVIAVPGDLRKASYIQAEELLERTVCSAYRTHGLWHIASSYDPMEREISPHHSGMMKRRCL